ncbi:hypothetical protein CAPTEDRAFT_214504 [Capitella teleta]|uniref:HTH CENPB-type domain-containing protein n=1 Tax=Capitella teleta TaxID=283909 RepID=R7V6I1_CAPTE|nr:hypothetical protein CAPTEDRAFT_214504 [Capitella teleta]|eukprot:ELU11370.1 hypothetical protein CAPTEDRAFT_214504 [Capitella teleta]
MAKFLGIPDFKASHGWLHRFKQRHEITSKVISGDLSYFRVLRIRSISNFIWGPMKFDKLRDDRQCCQCRNSNLNEKNGPHARTARTYVNATHLRAVRHCVQETPAHVGRPFFSFKLLFMRKTDTVLCITRIRSSIIKPPWELAFNHNNISSSFRIILDTGNCLASLGLGCLKADEVLIRAGLSQGCKGPAGDCGSKCPR